jgi:cytochrome c oxidase subunit 4/cytochrome o ubiquinol oxidase operon protein cyoD
MAHSPEAHSESTRLYWIVAGALAVVTILEVLVTFLGLDQLVLVAILMVLSFAKGAAVVMFFMHLKGDARVFKFLFIAPFFIAVSMILLFLALFSGHNGLAG